MPHPLRHHDLHAPGAVGRGRDAPDPHRHLRGAGGRLPRVLADRDRRPGRRRRPCQRHDQPQRAGARGEPPDRDRRPRRAATPAPVGRRRSYSIVVDNHGGLAPPGARPSPSRPGRDCSWARPPATSGIAPPTGAASRARRPNRFPPLGDYPPLGFSAYVGGAAYPYDTVSVSVAAPGEANGNDNFTSVTTLVTGAPDLEVMSVEAERRATTSATTRTSRSRSRTSGRSSPRVLST